MFLEISLKILEELLIILAFFSWIFFLVVGTVFSDLFFIYLLAYFEPRSLDISLAVLEINM